MKKPFFDNGATRSETRQDWVLTRRCHSQNTLAMKIWLRLLGVESSTIFILRTLLAWWMEAQPPAGGKAKRKNPLLLGTNSRCPHWLQLHLVFTWFSPSFHPAVGGVGASVGGELGSPFQPFFNSMLPLNYKFRRSTWTVWNASFHFVEYQSLPDSRPVISTPSSTSIEVLFPWAAAPFHQWPRNPIFHWWYFSHQFHQP